MTVLYQDYQSGQLKFSMFLEIKTDIHMHIYKNQLPGIPQSFYGNISEELFIKEIRFLLLKHG